MDNISKYPKDWYKQLTRKKKPQLEELETSEKSKNDKSRRSSNQQVKSSKEKQEASDNGEKTGGNKSDDGKEATTE